jgi:hypothetical protein
MITNQKQIMVKDKIIKLGKKIYPKLIRKGAKDKNTLLFVIGNTLKKQIKQHEELERKLKLLKEQDKELKKTLEENLRMLKHEIRKQKKRNRAYTITKK